MRRALPLLVAVCLNVAFAAGEARAAPNGNAELCAAQGKDAVSPQQRIAACAALIEAAKDDTKALVAALIDRAAAMCGSHRAEQAPSDLDRAIALDPKNARAYRERAKCYRVIGRLDRALADANEAVRLDPTNADAFETRGNVFNINRQYDRAIDDYNAALRLDPNFAQAFMDRGAAYYFKADYDRALENYDQAIKLDSKRAQAFSNRGAVYKKLGRHELALTDESEAIRLDPTMPEFFDNRGLSYAANGDFDRAIDDYDEAIRLRPQANFLTNRGDSYNRKGSYERAIDDYDRALKLNPGFYLAYNNRAVAYRRLGDLDRAVADLEQVLRINPRMDSAAESLANLRLERDRRAMVSTGGQRPSFDCTGARRPVEKAICSDPDLSRLDRQLDDAYKAALGKLDSAGVARLRREQRDFIAQRDKSFGRPDYRLKQEMERRLQVLREMAARN